MVFFTSDTHYGHKNLVKGTTQWSNPERCRDFLTVQEHDDFIVNQINSLVGQDDVLYHLGDWSFGGYKNIKKFRERIICKEIHLVLGNHDQNVEKNLEEYKDTFKTIQHYLEIEIDGNLIVMSHWPMKIWNKSHKGSWQLHGHCHNNLQPDDWWTSSKPDERRRTMDVGLDTNGLKPWSYEKIKRIMNKLTKYPSGLDHHEKDQDGIDISFNS